MGKKSSRSRQSNGPSKSTSDGETSVATEEMPNPVQSTPEPDDTEVAAGPEIETPDAGPEVELPEVDLPGVGLSAACARDIVRPLLARAVTVDVPLAPVDESANISTHVDVRLDRPQARTFRALFNALHERRARLKNERLVSGPNDAIRWLLEKLSDCDEEGVT